MDDCPRSLRVVFDNVPATLVFSFHACLRMAERRVGVEEVVEALREPCEHVYDRVRDTILVLGCNGVAVVYAMRGNVYEIVTVLRDVEYRVLVERLGRRRYKPLEASV